MTPKTKQQLFRLITHGKFPALIKITYKIDNVTNVMRIANNSEDIIYQDEVYQATTLKYTPPKYSDRKIGNASLTISTISQEVQDVIILLRSVQDRPTIQIIAAFYMEEGSEITFDPIDEWEFVLGRVTWNDYSADCELIYDTMMNKVVPADKMTPLKCPGIA